MITLDELLDLAHRQAKTFLIGGKRQLSPAFVIVDRDRRFILVATPWESDAQKDTALEMMRSLMRENQAVAYSFVCEAWMAAQKTEWKPGDVMPSNRPDRTEVVTAMASDGQETKYRTWTIVRGPKGECARLEPFDAGNTFTSRFEGLLPETKVH